MNAWRCQSCRAEFRTPSFSEGPKTKDPETGVESVRFAASLNLCPECMSHRIAPIPQVRQPALS